MNQNTEFILFTKKDRSQVFVPVYEGKPTDIIPKLIETNQTQISVKGIMEQRLNAWNSNNIELTKQWCSRGFYTGDGIIYHPDGRIKIVPNSPTLINYNRIPTDSKEYGDPSSLSLENGTFDKAQGFEFSKEEVEKYGNGEVLTKEQVIENPIWIALAQEDTKLLKEYIKQYKLKDKILGFNRLNYKFLKNHNDFWSHYINNWRDRNYYSETEKIVRFSNNWISTEDPEVVSNALLVAVPSEQGPLYVVNKQITFNLEKLLRDFSKLANEDLLNSEVKTLYENLQNGKYDLDLNS